MDEELIGAWRLVSYVNIDETGRTSEGPLGPAPEGVLIYSEHGYMAVSMMRTDGRPDGPDTGLGTGAGSRVPEANAGSRVPEANAGSRVPGERERFMGYSGQWRLADDRTVVHKVAVSAHPHQVGTEVIRQLQRDGDQLTLFGTAVLGGREQRRALRWRRA